MQEGTLQCRNILEATAALPIIGDGDTGFGNALSVKRTVHGFANAGFAGILIEDQVCVRESRSLMHFEKHAHIAPSVLYPDQPHDVRMSTTCCINAQCDWCPHMSGSADRDLSSAKSQAGLRWHCTSMLGCEQIFHLLEFPKPWFRVLCAVVLQMLPAQWCLHVYSKPAGLTP